MIGVKLVRVAIDLDLTFRGTGDRYRTHTGHSGQRSCHLFVKYLLERIHRLAGSGGHNHDRHVVRTELEYHRSRNRVRKVGGYKVKLVPDIIGRSLHIDSLLELESDDAGILLGAGRDILQIADTVEAVLEDLCHIGLDILGTGSLIGRHHHDVA